MYHTVYPHYTECPPTAAAIEACRLLDLGISPLALLPSEGPGTCEGWLPQCPRYERRKPGLRDESMMVDWLHCRLPLLICEELPGFSDLGPHRHVLLPSIDYDFAAHSEFLRILGRMKTPLRLHLFLNPTGKIDPRLRAMLPKDLPTELQPTPEIDIDRMLTWSLKRHGEFHPFIVKPLRKDSGDSAVTAEDIQRAIALIDTPTPSQFDISRSRLNNVKKKKQ